VLRLRFGFGLVVFQKCIKTIVNTIIDLEYMGSILEVAAGNGKNAFSFRRQQCQ